MVYYDPRKPKPWPIRLLNKWGVADDTLATHLVIFIIVIFIVISTYLLFTTYMQEPIDRTTSDEQFRS